MSVEENKAAIRKYFDEAYNSGNVDAIDDIIATSYVNHHSAKGDVQSGAQQEKDRISK